MQVATPNSAIPTSGTGSSAAAAAVAAAAGVPTDSTMTQMILEHPLYPLLQMVFQKCELATSSPRDAQAEAICSSESFKEDISNFIHDSRQRQLPLTTGVHDVDRFMLKSIEVLRIHLLELEKVHQLCDNFCQRYINCLKGKLPIDLVVDDGSSRDTNSASRNGNQQDGGPSSNNNNNNNQQNNNNNNSGSNNNNSSSNGQSNNQSNNEQNNGHNHQNNTNNNNSNHHHHHQAAAQELASNGYPGGAAEAAYVQQAAYAQQAAAAAAYGNPYGAGADHPHRMNPYAAHHYASGPHYGANLTGQADHSALANVGGAAPTNLKQEHLASQASNNNQQTTQQASNNNNHHPHHHHRELTGSSGSSSASSIKMEHAGQNGAQYGSEANSATSAPDRQQLHDDVRSPTGSTGSFLGDASLGSGDGTECEDDDNRGRRQQKKRGIFPKAATNIMRAWLFQHLNHPYPSEDQKKQLAEETGLTILQVNNWFINARRRIVQPMIDQSNRSSGNIMAGPAYSPDAGMGYMLDSGQPFRSLPGVDSAGMGPLASHAAMTSAMGAYSAAASAQHLSQYGRNQQHQAAMLGLSTPPTGPHMMGAHPTLPPHGDYY